MSSSDHANATEFLAALPFTIPILWQGTSGLHEIDDDRRATLELCIHGYGDHYEGIRVSIASKTNGEIVTKWFAFDDHLNREDRADARRGDYPIGNNKQCFVIIAYCGWGWYIAEPSHPEHFTQAIETWLDGWR